MPLRHNPRPLLTGRPEPPLDLENEASPVQGPQVGRGCDTTIYSHTADYATAQAVVPVQRTTGIVLRDRDTEGEGEGTYEGGSIVPAEALGPDRPYEPEDRGENRVIDLVNDGEIGGEVALLTRGPHTAYPESNNDLDGKDLETYAQPEPHPNLDEDDEV